MKTSSLSGLCFASLFSLAAVAVQADTTDVLAGKMTYEVFEHSIEHADLAACPAEFDDDTQFCRMTLADDRLHIFVFGLDGDQTLMAVKSYDLDDGLPQF